MRRSIFAVLMFAGLFARSGEAMAAAGVSQFRGQVLVGEDGNGVLADTFPTSVAGEGVQYILSVENGRATSSSGRTKRAKPVEGLQVTLNGDVIFLSNADFTSEMGQIALNPTTANDISVASTGPAGSAAVVSIVARAALIAVGGRSILPAANTTTMVTFHNAGPGLMALRLSFFNPDGSLAGRSAPQALASHASGSIDLGVAGGPISWTQGAVHINWARSQGWVGVGAEAHIIDSGYGLNATEVTNARELLLDTTLYPVAKEQFDDITGGLLD